MTEPYSAIGFRVMFSVENGPHEMFEDHDPARWELHEDEAVGEAICQTLMQEITDHLGPVFDHFSSLGCVRADIAGDGDAAPMFFLLQKRGGDPETGFLDLDEFERTLTALPAAALKVWTVGAGLDPVELHGLLSSLDPASSVATWGGEATPDRLPALNEMCDAWLARVAIPSDVLVRVNEQWALVGRDIDLYARNVAPRTDAMPSWAVEGVIGFGVVTLLAGSSGVGKSSLAQQLTSAVVSKEGSRPRTFLGQPVTGRYPAAILCGEEPDWIFEYRRERHETIWSDCRAMIFSAATGDDLASTLSMLEHAPPGVLVIDPFQAFATGDDTRSHYTSEFYNPLVAFARRTGWAVIVVVHLVKDGVRSLSKMIPSVKGSTVHTDRARMVIGMIARGNGVVEVGPIKSNFPADLIWCKLNEGRLYRQEEETQTLVPVAFVAAPAQESSSANDAIFEAIAELNRAGMRVKRTGPHSVYAAKLPGLAGMSRNSIDAVVKVLMTTGRVVDAGDSLMAVIEPPLASDCPKA